MQTTPGFTKSVSARSNKSDGGSVVSLALIALLLISTVAVVSVLSLLFVRELAIKERLNQILRTAEGKIGLWTNDPQSSAYQAELMNLIGEVAANRIPGGAGDGSVVSATLQNYGYPIKTWFAFLPPGECATLDNGRVLCNSHMCSLPPARTTRSRSLCYACSTSDPGAKPRMFNCNSIPSGYEQCGNDDEDDDQQSRNLGPNRAARATASEFCAQATNSDRFLAKVEEFPTEVAAVIETRLFGGLFKVERKIMVQGYPRVLSQQVVAASTPPPVCGQWVPANACPVVPPCGNPALTYQIPLSWTCSTPAIGCRAPTNPSGVCGPSPGGSLSCPYQLCVAHGCVTSSCPPAHSGVMNVCHRYENGVDVGVAPNSNCNGGAGCPNTCRPIVTTYQCLSTSCPPNTSGSASVCHRFVDGVDQGVASNGNCNNGAGCPTSCAPICNPWVPVDQCPANIPCGTTQSRTRTFTCPLGNCCGAQPAPVNLNDNACPGNPCPVCDTYALTFEARGDMNIYNQWGAYGPSVTRLMPRCLGSWVHQYCASHPIPEGDPNVCRSPNNPRGCIPYDEALHDRRYFYDKDNSHTWELSYNESRTMHWCFTSGAVPGFNNYTDCTNSRYPMTDPRCRMLDLSDISRFFGVPRPSGPPASCFNNVWEPLTDLTACTTTFYFNDQCRPVPASANLCNWFNWEMTPISLLFTEKEEAEKEATVVKFRMDPTLSNDQWIIWKGSEKAPLLVYDPKHEGKIVSAYQLFGSYALGGKTTLLSEIIIDANAKPREIRWKSGYEALALLDLDGDGSLREAELADLGLWFDKNKNGVSEKGDVLSLKDVGISALFYRNPANSGKDLLLAKGFEKVVDRQVTEGASVDWFVDSFSSQAEAMTSLFGKPAATEPEKPADKSTSLNNSLEEWQGEKLSLARDDQWDPITNLNGIWLWTLASDQKLEQPGVFFINELGGEIWGWSVIEVPAKSKSNKSIAYAQMTLPLHGKRVIAPDGAPAVMLEVRSPNTPKAYSRSLVRVGKYGLAMTGESEQIMVDKAGRTTTMKYDWTAVRFQEKPKG